MVEVIGTGLGKRYANGTWGLRDLDIRVRGGTFLAVIGHNGAGKSTLLNMLGRVLRPTRGTLEIRPREVRPSWSPQRVLVDWSLSVRQNVELAALLAGHRTPATVRPAVDEVLELLDLAKVAGEEAENLSGGQLQRVQIARALAVESGLYVMDEPAAGLDPAAADLVMNHLRDKASLGAAVVVSSHDLDAVERTADHLLLLDSGAAVADLPVAEFVASTGGRMAVTVKVEGSAPDFVADTPESWTVTRSDDRSSLVFDVPISVPVGDVLAAVPAGLAVADLDVRRQSLRDVYLARSAGGE